MEANGSYYEIRIRNNHDGDWLTWFEGMAITHLENGETIIAGMLMDQAALHGLLDRLRSLDITLISVRPIPTLTDLNDR